jgi:hypothetical protein
MSASVDSIAGQRHSAGNVVVLTPFDKLSAGLKNGGRRLCFPRCDGIAKTNPPK